MDDDSSRKDYIEMLARELHFKMEHLDPTQDADWNKMHERRKDFYRQCVEHLLLHKTILRLLILD